MSITKKRIGKVFLLISMITLLVFSLVGCGAVFTTEDYRPTPDYGYYIENYSVDAVIDEDKVMTITESITGVFNSYTNGIVRNIPISQTIGVPDGNGGRTIRNYENEISNFTVLSQDAYLLDVVEDSGNMFYYIARTGGISSGETYTFTYSYTFDPGDDRDTSKDFLYWNIIGTGVNTDIMHVDFSITFPTSIEGNIDLSGLIFYVGGYGEDSTGTQVEYHIGGENGNTIIGSYGDGDTYLGYGDAITIYLPLNEGYFNADGINVYDILLLVAFFLAVAVILVLFILNRKKDPVIDVVEFSAPDGLTPTEAGFIIDNEVSGDDITALLVYWADKGYVQIEQKEKKIYIKRLKPLGEEGKEHERIFFNAIFKNDEPIDCEKLKFLNGFVGQLCKKAVEKKRKTYFNTKTNTIYKWTSIIVTILMILDIVKIGMASHDGFSIFIKILLCGVMLLTFLFLPQIEKNKEKEKKGKFWTKKIVNLIFLLGCFAGFIFYAEGYCDPLYTRVLFCLLPLLLWIVYPFMEQYTKRGREVLGKLRGLKQYIEVAEKDRMEAMVNEDPELFYKVLPYAYVLGVSKVYLEKFEDIPISNPAWLVTDNVLTLWLTINLMTRNFAIISALVNQTLAKHIIATVAKIAVAATISSIDGDGGFSGGGSGGGGVGRF